VLGALLLKVLVRLQSTGLSRAENAGRARPSLRGPVALLSMWAQSGGVLVVQAALVSFGGGGVDCMQPSQ
jgi:hypothetical protein